MIAKYDGFFGAIERFNQMFALPGGDTPTCLGPERIRQFISIIKEEVEEGFDVADGFVGLDRLVAMADWLGDLIVYCASEMRRWGLPTERILDIIMMSNFTKLGVDGRPIYDSRAKVLKGPNFVPPEPAIRKLLQEMNP